MSKVVVFDLDGTLLDSAPDIHAAVNRVIGRRGLAPYSLDEVKAMIGDGVKVLTERFLAGRGRAYDQACHDELVADEDIRSARLTAPFEGIAEVLSALEAEGYPVARSYQSYAFGAPHGLLIRDGACSGGADPQRDGMAMSA